jgi:hypothetical protein
MAEDESGRGEEIIESHLEACAQSWAAAALDSREREDADERADEFIRIMCPDEADKYSQFYQEKKKQYSEKV